MNREGLQISERIDEVTRICAREHPIYEQISNFSIALYVFGHFKCPDLISCDDVDTSEAALVLKEDFTKIAEEDLPLRYHILESQDHYLLVFGDPLYPVHFAVLADTDSSKPYFSKLKFFGSGFDSLEELKSEFVGKDGVGQEVHFFKRKRSTAPKAVAMGRIYTVKDDGSYSVFDDESSTHYKEAKACR